MGPYLPMQNYQDIGKISVRACNYLQAPAEKHNQVKYIKSGISEQSEEILLHSAVGR